MNTADDFDSLSRQFGLKAEELISKEKIVQALSARVADMMQYATDQLFSMLYRLDISEKKLQQVIHSEVDVAKNIAELIFERQMEKAHSRRQHKSTPPDPDIAW
jgi:hypothetical protein